MANLLETSTQEEIMRLLQLGWSRRRIARELKVDRGTVSRYSRSALPSSSVPADRERLALYREEHDPHVEQLRPLARVLLLQARREMAARVVRPATDTTTRMGSHQIVRRTLTSQPAPLKFKSRLLGAGDSPDSHNISYPDESRNRYVVVILSD